MNPTELIAKWRHVIDQTSHIWSWSEPHALAYWAEMASTRNKIIEIGTHLGKSAKVMLLANPNCKLWCIDGWHEPGTEHTARHFLKAEIEQGRCALSRLDFPTSMIQLESIIHNGRFDWMSIDLILLDDGHREDEVRNQIELFKPFLRPGGLLCGHDLDRNPDNGVTKAVKELIPDFEEPVPRCWSKIV